MRITTSQSRPVNETSPREQVNEIVTPVHDQVWSVLLLGPGLAGRVPEAKTVWVHRGTPAQAGKVDERLADHLPRHGLLARVGQILDASAAMVPHNRSGRDKKAAVEGGEIPRDLAGKPANRSQKDFEARWTERLGKSHGGHRYDVILDHEHKLVRHGHVRDEIRHGKRAADTLLSRKYTFGGGRTDAGSVSAAIQGVHKVWQMTGHICLKGKPGYSRLGQRDEIFGPRRGGACHLRTGKRCRQIVRQHHQFVAGKAKNVTMNIADNMRCLGIFPALGWPQRGAEQARAGPTRQQGPRRCRPIKPHSTLSAGYYSEINFALVLKHQ